MSVSNIIDEATGKIDSKYIPAIAPPATPNLNQVLTAGNQTGGVLIDAQGGNVICDAMKCISIESATAPLFNDIAVDANLITAQFGKNGFSADALITCNEQNSTKKVIETTNASTNAIYKVAEGNINYETQTKILTVNPLSFPPSPLLSTQGLVVNGSVKAPFLGSTLTPYSQVVGYDSVSGQLIAQPAGSGGGVQNPMISNLDAGNYMITNANDIQTNSIFISKDTGISGGQPRIEFQDNTGFAQGQVGWNSITGRTLLSGNDGFKINKAGDKYKIEASDAIGYLGIETSGVDTEIRHYDATASIMETRVRVNGGGNMSIGGAYDGSLFLEKAGGGTYAGVNINNTDDLTLFSGGGDIITTQALRPDGGIKDITNSTGLAGEYLSKNGSNQLSWSSSAPATWAPTAMSDLDMNGFKITDNVGNLNLQASGGNNVVINSSGGAKLIQTAGETQVIGDTGSAYTPTLRFIDTNFPSASVLFEAQPPSGYLSATNVNLFQVWTGAVEGVQMGVNNSVGYENYFRGMGLPLRISQSQTDESTTYMLMDSGSINLTANSQINMTATDKVVVSNPTGNSTEFVLQQSNPSILGGGSIIADAGSGEFVFKGAGDGTVTVVRGATFTSIQALAPDAVISNAVGGGEVITELSADGSGKGKIYMKAETSSSPSEFTVDGTTGSGVITAKSNQLVLDINGSVGTAGQALISNGTSAIWSDNPAVWGSFLNTGNVNISTPNLVTAIPHNTTTVASNCALSGGSIVVQKACSKLRIQSSLIASPSTNNTTFRFWLSKSSANVPNTQSIVTLKSAADKALCVCEWYVSAVVGDIFTILCEADFASTIYTEAATGSRPACPSIITTLQGYA